MPRLLIHVEGQTEEAFVNEVPEQYLLARGYHNVAARIVGNARLRRRRGGIRPWPSVRKDILHQLPAGLLYVTADPLGGTRLVTDATGSPLGYHDYCNLRKKSRAG